jgi:hypothetical protein
VLLLLQFLLLLKALVCGVIALRVGCCICALSALRFT